jgi:hypothetical protein
MTETPATDELHARLAELTDRSLSPSARYGHLVLTVVAAVMASVLGALVFTEPGLSARALASFWVLFAIAVAWVAFGLRVLSRRRPLLANREVVAGAMAVGFSAVFTAGAAAVGVFNGGRARTDMATLGATMTLVAIAVLVRALVRRAELRALRARLEQELASR